MLCACLSAPTQSPWVNRWLPTRPRKYRSRMRRRASHRWGTKPSPWRVPVKPTFMMPGTPLAMLFEDTPRDTHHVAIGGQVETTGEPSVAERAVVTRSASRTSSAARRVAGPACPRAVVDHFIVSVVDATRWTSICRRRRPVKLHDTFIHVRGYAAIPPISDSSTTAERTAGRDRLR